MYEIFENIEDNREIASYYQALSNYKTEEFSGGDCPKTKMNVHRN